MSNCCWAQKMERLSRFQEYYMIKSTSFKNDNMLKAHWYLESLNLPYILHESMKEYYYDLEYY